MDFAFLAVFFIGIISAIPSGRGASSSSGSFIENICDAIQQDNIDHVQDLLQSPYVDINQKDPANGKTALIYAAMYGNPSILRLIIENPEVDINAQDELGATALILATLFNNADCVKILSQHPSINLNIQDKNGRTALMWAIYANREDIVVMLVNEPGIDFAVEDLRGESVLDYARNLGRTFMENMIYNAVTRERVNRY